MAGFIVHKVLKSVVQLANADDEFFEAQQNHPGVESATSALRSGNGMKRCRDRSEIGLDRYVPLAIPGRNRQTLGHLLIAQQAPQSEAAATRRKAAQASGRFLVTVENRGLAPNG